jgi:tRNA threonylcarbamoyladenosine biosynthesis protein TsaE
MKGKTFSLSLDNSEQIAADFIEAVGTNRKFAFYGAMGAGKTTFITALCNKLKTIDLVSSPTFAIVNEYETELHDIIYHFDFYRIKNSEELYDIGFEEYCQQDSWCFIEWPEKAEELLPDDIVPVTIKVGENNLREIQITFPV